MSRDDSDLAAMMASSPAASMARGGGLKGRLRRALSVNAAQSLAEEPSRPSEDQATDDDESIKASSSGRLTPSAQPSGSSSKMPVSQSVAGSVTDDGESTATVQTKKKSRAASLFNSRFNASTDNISLSSTVSSASVMIRKLGSMGNLARRNSLAGITSLFKDKKDKNKDGEDSKKDKKKKDKKGGKGDASQASVSHATAELDRGSSDWQVGTGEVTGLSPAAKLARQHTLKSNAEAAARAQAQQEAAAAAAAAPNVNGVALPDTWEKNTSTRAGQSPARTGGARRVNEDGTRVLVEDDDDSASETGSEGTYDAHRSHVPGQVHTIAEGWDEDEDWDGQDQDVTIRLNLETTRLGDPEVPESEEWGGGVRRSVERTRQPKKGILKCAYLVHTV